MNYKTLFQGQYLPDQVQIQLTETQRKTDAYIENIIEQEWSRRVEKYPQVFNGLCYRLLHHKADEKVLSLELSTTSYKEAKGIPVPYVLEHYQQEYFPQALACSVFLMTKDEKVILGRSRNRDLLIGGSYSPEECVLTNGADIFQMAYLEVLQETGIATADILSMNLVGAVQMNTLNISLIFEGTVFLTEDEVLKRFKEKHDPELDDLMFVPVSEMKQYVSSEHANKQAIWDCLSIF